MHTAPRLLIVKPHVRCYSPAVPRAGLKLARHASYGFLDRYVYQFRYLGTLTARQPQVGWH